MNYIIHLMIMTGIYLILSYSLNLIVGFSGLLCLCHAVFYGIGAYSCALLMIEMDLSFLSAIGFSTLITGMVAMLIGLPALRFRKDTFVLVSLGFQIITFTVLYNWVSLTKGPYGIAGIPRAELFGYLISSPLEYLILVLLFLILVLSILFLLYRSPFGLALKSLRDNEMAAAGLGKNPLLLFLFAFILAGSSASVAGSLYAVYVAYIDPTSFSLDESIFLLTILLVGGSGNKLGPLFGTLLMILLPELLRFIGLPDSIAPNVRQIIYGAILIILMFLRPKGLLGSYAVR